MNDERHSKVVGIDAGYPENWSVGDVCQHIIGGTLSAPFYRHIPGTKMNYHRFKIPSFAKNKDELKEWCLERKELELYKLQIEACEWALKEFESKDDPPDLDAKQKREISGLIREEIESLKKSKCAIRCPSSF